MMIFFCYLCMFTWINFLYPFSRLLECFKIVTIYIYICIWKVNVLSICFACLLRVAWACFVMTLYLRANIYPRVIEFFCCSSFCRVRSIPPTSFPWALRLWAPHWTCTRRPWRTCCPPQPSLTTSSTFVTSPGSSWVSALSRRNRWRTRKSSSGKKVCVCVLTCLHSVSPPASPCFFVLFFLTLWSSSLAAFNRKHCLMMTSLGVFLYLPVCMPLTHFQGHWRCWNYNRKLCFEWVVLVFSSFSFLLF